MPLAIAETTYFHFTTRALAISPSHRAIHVNMRRLDPFPTPSSRAIYTILGSVLLVFPIPQYLKFIIKETVDVLEWNAILRATPWRHMLRIGHRHGEDAPETCMAHPMAARKFRSFGSRHIIREARETFDPIAICQIIYG